MWYPEGLDCVWLVSDAAGHVAVLYTAGDGPVPTCLLENGEDAFFEPYDELEGMEPVTEALPAGTPTSEIFDRDARLGFYVFDWSDVHRMEGRLNAYEITSRPVVPVTIDRLPPRVAEAAKKVVVPVDLAEAGTLDIASWYVCVESGFSS